MPEDITGEFRLTVKDLAGTQVAQIEEAVPGAKELILGVSMRRTQTVGPQGGRIQVENSLARTASWAPGYSVLLEGRLPGSQGDYAPILDGYLDEPVDRPGTDDPVTDLVISGWMDHLDLATVESELSFDEDELWTDIAGAILDASTLGSGYARSITADAAEVGWSGLVIQAGTSVRQALEIVRAGLNQGSDKWEHVVEKVAGVKTYRLYKRSSTVQRTIELEDLYVDSSRHRGNVAGIVNKATVYGATVSNTILDYTGLAHVAYNRLDATTKRLAQPFIATDSPLYGVQVYAARSLVSDPPTLTGFVARASDNLSLTRLGYLYKATTLGEVVNTPLNLTDGDTSTKATFDGTGTGSFQLICSADLESPKTVRMISIVQVCVPAAGTPQYRIDSSDDGSSWTTRVAATNFTLAASPGASPVNGSGHVHDLGASGITAQYWRVMTNHAVTSTPGIFEFHLLPYRTSATDPTNPKYLVSLLNQALDRSTMTTTGAVTKEVCNFDFTEDCPIIKVQFKHQESAASALLNYVVQKSDNGSDWTDLAILPSTTSLVTDTIYIEGPEFRYLRIISDDDRAAASASITENFYFCDAFLHDTLNVQIGVSINLVWGVLTPLTGDQMKGSAVSWDVTSLVDTPGLLEQRTYPSPRLALEVNHGRYYYFVLQVSGGSATSFWDISRGAPASVAYEALSSTDSGATWASLGTDATIRMRLEFNHSQLVGEAEDAASQATYANFIPSGVLQASYTDLALLTQSAVDAKAAMIVNRNKTPQATYTLVIQGDPTLIVGQRITLAADAAEVLGAGSSAIDLDVVAIEDVADQERYVTILTCGEHILDPLDAATQVASVSNQRRI